MRRNTLILAGTAALVTAASGYLVATKRVVAEATPSDAIRVDVRWSDDLVVDVPRPNSVGERNFITAAPESGIATLVVGDMPLSRGEVVVVENLRTGASTELAPVESMLDGKIEVEEGDELALTLLGSPVEDVKAESPDFRIDTVELNRD